MVQDLRNHGDSPHDVRHDYTAMAEDVEAFIMEKCLEKPTLIGHSMLVAVLARSYMALLIFLVLQGSQSCHGLGSPQSAYSLCAHSR